MDYTSTPGHNKHPGTDNFLFLQEMYGTINDRRGLLRRLGYKSATPSIAHELRHEMMEAVRQLELRNDGLEHLEGWFEEHRSDFGSVHSRNFGKGYTVKVAKLFASN